MPYSSGGGQVLVHGDRDWSNSSDLFSALIPRVFNCKDRTYCTLFTPANTKMLHENNCVIILSVRGFERVEIRKETYLIPKWQINNLKLNVKLTIWVFLIPCTYATTATPSGGYSIKAILSYFQMI